MNPFRSSLYWRLLVGFCLANLVVLLAGGSLAQRFIEYTTAVEIDWPSLAQDAEQAYEAGGTQGLADWSHEQRRDGMLDAVLFEHGRPLIPTRLTSMVQRDLPGWLGSGRDVVVQPRPGLYLAVQSVQGSDGQARQLVALSRSHKWPRQHTRQKILLGVQAALSLLLIGVIGWWIARSVARPVAALRAATRRMAAGELSTRVHWKNGRGRDELAHLAGDFDAMAERIEALVAHDRGVLQDLSHELRSPLARLQLLLDFAQRSGDPEEAAGYFRKAEQEIERLDRMTGDMLALSRLEGGLPGEQRQPLDLAALVRECAARAQVEADARGIVFQVEAAGPVIVSGHALLLERALDNLLSNAIKFSHEGGKVLLAARAEGGLARLSVRDHGPGVPPDERDALFRPFFRGSNAPRAEGHGLGLAIVQRVAIAHDGTVHAENAPGGGLDVQLRLSLATSDE